jgi:hypothetical protein
LLDFAGRSLTYLIFFLPSSFLGAVAPTCRLSLAAANMTATPAAGTGVALLYTAIVLLVLTWFTFILRCWVRVVRKTWGSDDYLMLIGLVWSTPD